jgi:hypothetical protein
VPLHLKSIAGFNEVASWFGDWPSFHDAEILQLCLDRTGQSFLKVLTWQRTREVDERGVYVQKKHAVVVFLLDGVRDVSLDGFNHQNVIFGLDVETTETGVKLTMDPCFGLSGSIEAKGLRLELQPQGSDD